MPPAEQSRAGIAAAVQTAVAAPCDPIVRVAPFAVGGSAFEPDLLRERRDRIARLIPLHRAQPGIDYFKHALHGRKPFGDPFVVVGLAMTLDMSQAEDAVEATEDLRRHADLPMLCRRCPNAIPRWASDTRSGSGQPETAFTIEEAGSPGAIQTPTGFGRKRVQRDGGDLHERTSPPGPTADAAQRVLLVDCGDRARSLPAFDRSDPGSEQGDRRSGLTVIENPPQVQAVRFPADRAHPVHGRGEPNENLRNDRMALLRHGDIESAVTRASRFTSGHRAAFAVEEPSRPRTALEALLLGRERHAAEYAHPVTSCEAP